MLMLTRKAGEVIAFPDLGIRIVVVDVDRHRAKIGVEAPRDIKVVREEILTSNQGGRDVIEE